MTQSETQALYDIEKKHIKGAACFRCERKAVREGFDLERMRYLCPMCKTFCYVYWRANTGEEPKLGLSLYKVKASPKRTYFYKPLNVLVFIPLLILFVLGLGFMAYFFEPHQHLLQQNNEFYTIVALELIGWVILIAVFYIRPGFSIDAQQLAFGSTLNSPMVIPWQYLGGLRAESYIEGEGSSKPEWLVEIQDTRSGKWHLFANGLNKLEKDFLLQILRDYKT